MIREIATVASAVGASGIFAALINGGFGRRKTNAETDLTSGQAWQNVVLEKDKDVAHLRGEVQALREEVSKLQRKNEDHLVWQVHVVAREGVVQALLASKGIKVPDMPDPPAYRGWRTRAEDKEAT